MIWTYLEAFTFENLLDEALSRVPDNVDKRQGSIIYDALAPSCYQLAEFYMQLRQLLMDAFVTTSTGEALDLKVIERGVVRKQATYALKRADFTLDGTPQIITLGSRFSTIGDNNLIYFVKDYYRVDGEIVPGAYILECETPGTEGNSYVGDILQITYNNLSTAVMSTLLEPADDDETDASLLERYLEAINESSFGGNVSQYKTLINDIDGVGAVQVYPVWDGGGSVKCSIVDTDYNPASSEFIEAIEALVDPENAVGDKGTGLGIAPIGHKVTISTASNVVANITSQIVLGQGFVLGQVEAPITAAILAYITNVRHAWATSNQNNEYSVGVYTARLNAAILSVNGVVNIISTHINGVAADLSLSENSTLQQIPVLGTVVLSVS